MTDADIEHANARMLDAFRQCDALRLQLAEVERERDAAWRQLHTLSRSVDGAWDVIEANTGRRQDTETESIEDGVCRMARDFDWRAKGEGARFELNREIADLKDAMAAERLDFNRMLGEVRRQWDEERCNTSRMRERADRAEAERDALLADAALHARNMEQLADQRNEAIARAERVVAERDAAKARALPGGRDPGARLPVVPATCGECEHLGHAVPGGGHYCTRADKAVVMAYTAIPAHWCPVRVDRAELAKAGVR